MSTLRSPAMALALAGIRPGAALFVALVTAVAGAATLPILGSAVPPIGAMAAWFFACVAGEFLSMPTPTGRGRISSATTFHLAMALSLSPPEFLPVLWLSRLLAKGLIEQQPWYRALFNSAQVVLAVSAAWTVQAAVLGLDATTDGRGLFLSAGVSPYRAAAAIVAAATAYYIVNTGLVSGILTLTGGGSLLANWRRNYGWSMELLSTAALLSLAPAVVVSVQQVGLPGLLFILAPIALIHVAGRCFLAFDADQRSLIERERLSAKSEISTMVGFELTAALTSISGEVQLLARRWPGLTEGELQRRVDAIRATIDRTGELTRGLTEFSRAEFHPERVPAELIVRRALAFLKTEGRLQGLSTATVVDPALQEIFVDPLQLQQVIINLVQNSADAIRESRTTPGVIHIRLRPDASRRGIELVVDDNGPGLPTGRESRLFEPGFTTRPGRPGFGLSTVHRIVRNHDGEIEARTRPAGGTRLWIRLPFAYRPPRHIP